MRKTSQKEYNSKFQSKNNNFPKNQNDKLFEL